MMEYITKLIKTYPRYSTLFLVTIIVSVWSLAVTYNTIVTNDKETKEQFETISKESKEQYKLLNDEIKKIKGAVAAIGSALNRKLDFEIFTPEQYQKLISSQDKEELFKNYKFMKTEDTEGVAHYMAVPIPGIGGYLGLLKSSRSWDMSTIHKPNVRDAPYSQYEIMHSEYARIKDEYYWLDRRVKILEEELGNGK